MLSTEHREVLARRKINYVHFLVEYEKVFSLKVTMNKIFAVKKNNDVKNFKDDLKDLLLVELVIRQTGFKF